MFQDTELSVLLPSYNMNLLNALVKIHQKTGFRLKYPQNPEQFKRDDYQHVFIVADRIVKGRVPVKNVNATIELPRNQVLLLLDEYEMVNLEI